MKNTKFETILRYTQEELYDEIFNKFLGKETMYYRKGSYILVEGEAPVLLIAHLDTVHEKPVKDIVVESVKVKTGETEVRISSPEGIGGDDRCGVYAILSVYEKADIKPWLLFVCDEECGCVGSRQFTEDYGAENTIIPSEFDDIKFMIEIDRKGHDDSVYYDCDNPEFEAWINSFGFITETGSYSDICEVAPVMRKAAVNLSSGYYNAHTTKEYIVEAELDETIDKVNRIVTESLKDEVPAYEYIERKYDWSEYWDYKNYISTGKYGYHGYYDSYDNYNDDDDDRWEMVEYHTEQDYKDRCIKLNLGEIDINYCIAHKLNSTIWAEYLALLDYESVGELDALRGACGDDGILDEFHRQCGSWKGYYEDMCAYYDTSAMYC